MSRLVPTGDEGARGGSAVDTHGTLGEVLALWAIHFFYAGDRRGRRTEECVRHLWPRPISEVSTPSSLAVGYDYSHTLRGKFW